MVTIDVGGASRAKGSSNEDAMLIAADLAVFGVFDGLGSTMDAAVAAPLAAIAIHAAYRYRPPTTDGGAERAFLALAVRGAGALVAATTADGLTTASVVRVCELGSEASAVICNVGDSRVYRYAAGGELRQNTLDDSVFAADWDLQRQLGESIEPTGFVESAYFQLRHIMSSALGDGVSLPHVWDVPVTSGDLLLAATDGVTDNLTFSEIADVLSDTSAEPTALAHRLVDAALARSRQADHYRAKTDDITAVVARVEGTSR